MEIKSKEFVHQGKIPPKFTCQGQNINPQLVIENIPPKTKSLALIVDDPDAYGRTFVHWVVYNIAFENDTLTIEEDSIPGIQGGNDFGERNYGGPCPPTGVHRYFFKIFALDIFLKLSEGASKSEVEKAMQGHILCKAELMGLYQKK